MLFQNIILCLFGGLIDMFLNGLIQLLLDINFDKNIQANKMNKIGLLPTNLILFLMVLG
jgi:hypothetical protein